MLARDFYPIASKNDFRHYTCMNGDKFVTLLQRKIESDPDLTVAGLASRAKLDKSTIRKLISGDNNSPKVATAEKICRAMGTTLEEFMGSSRDPLQQEIVALYNQLSPAERKILLSAARGIAAEGQKAD